ncbi:MAG: EAL domain-containing protein [Lachnospiraceae bacterium]|nr:EAL domain-containing protein [Lachnospiraceae bacterium]
MADRKRIAILVAQADEYYQAQFIEGFIGRAFEHNSDVLVFGSYLKYQNNMGREVGETSIFSLVPYEQFDAIAVMADTLQSPGLSESLEEIIHQRCKCPVVFIDKESKYFPSVFPNHYGAVKQLINHLIEDHGYTDIAYLTGKAWHHYSKQRLQAFMDSMSEHGLTVGRDRVFYGDFWYTSGENLGERLVRKGGKLPQAIACANDCMAIGLCKALEAGGIRVPGDIAVAGYDSTEEGRYSPKPVTSLKIPARSMGAYALDELFDLMEGRETAPFEDYGEFFCGRTCGCSEDKVQYETKLRKEWDTDTSHNSVFSSFNHLDEDMIIQNDFDGLMKTTFSYVFQIRDFESFSLCLNDNWQMKAKSLSGSIEDSRISPERLSDRDKFYTRKMMHVIACRSEELGQDRISDDVYFDRDVLIPRLDSERVKPEAFFFTPMHFEESTFGYAVLSYTEPKCYKRSYRFWLHSIMRGLENFRRYDELVSINKKLESSLVRDPLTGIFNYNGFLQQTEDTIIMSPLREGEKIGVLAIDIKNLSKINNDDGRIAGDNAIISVGRFMGEVFTHGRIYCIGNGEMIALEVMKEKDDVLKILEERVKELYGKIEAYNGSLDECARKLEVYYGTAEGMPRTKADYESVVSVALSRKNGQKLNFQKMNADGFDESQIEEAKVVNDILDKNKINYHFQPIVSARTGEIYAYEALMRVDTVPYVQPLLVIKYAGFFNRLYDVEFATFNNVLNYVRENAGKFKTGAKIFINSIPGQRLKKADMEEIYDKAKDMHGRLVVEFTEQSEMDDKELADMKKEYQSIGFETAIDDYGTGYSNVSNLLRYMPNYVKIDRALLANIQDSPQKQHFVKDIIEFSHDNNIMALAEGVETTEEIETVINLGVDLIQGYYTARPSEKIIKEIAPDIKAEIEKYSAGKARNRTRRDYVAGREARISLPILVKDGYNTIHVTAGHVTHRDLHIQGVPGDDAVISLEIENGYKGKIAIENCSFTGRMHDAAICIGDDCEVVISLTGENTLSGGGIKVSPKSSLTFEGAGNLSISSTGVEAFGIGNDMDSYHGDIVFDQDGRIEVSVNANKSVAVGSGLGGHITVRRGMYSLNLMGQNSVGIGSISGDIDPIISNCYLEVTSVALAAIGIGSIMGRCDMMIEHSSLKMDFNGNEVVMIGSKHSEKLQVSIYSATINMMSKAHDITAIGSGTAAPSNIAIDHVSLRVDLGGKQAGIYRGMDKRVKVRVSNSKTEGSIFTGLDVPAHANDMDFKVTGSLTKLDINGTVMTDNTMSERGENG